LHALYKMWGKYFITHIILVAAQDPWHLWSLFYHHTHTHTRITYTNLFLCNCLQNKAPHMCCSHVVRVRAWVCTQVHSHVICITWFVTQFINSDIKTFPFLGNVLSENNPAFEFYNYFVQCQMFWGVIEFSISLVQCVKDCLYFPWSVIFLILVGSLSICNGLVIEPPCSPW
jgi:hypothetical protein